MAYTEKEKEKRFENVLNHIRNGKALRNSLGLPDTFSNTVWDDIMKDEEKNEQYVRACDYRADILFEEILDIADNSDNDIKVNEDGIEVVNHENIQRSKLRVDARKWMVGKMKPRKYGDHIDVTTGGDKINDNRITDIIIRKTKD